MSHTNVFPRRTLRYVSGLSPAGLAPVASQCVFSVAGDMFCEIFYLNPGGAVTRNVFMVSGRRIAHIYIINGRISFDHVTIFCGFRHPVNYTGLSVKVYFAMRRYFARRSSN